MQVTLSCFQFSINEFRSFLERENGYKRVENGGGGNDNIGGGEERRDNTSLIKGDTILETEFLNEGIMERLRRKINRNSKRME